MKAVIYHAEAKKLWDAPDGLYQSLWSDWHGDSDAFAKLYEDMGSPSKFGITVDYNGLKVEIRDYCDYTLKHSRIMTHHKFKSKTRLV